MSFFSPVYFVLARLHWTWMTLFDGGFRRGRGPALRIPMVVVGALRAGGSGKSSVTLELARMLAAKGLRPALLAYRLGPGRATAGSAGVLDPMEVGPDDDWRESSDEAVLLRRESGFRVFVTRDRARAWRLLHRASFQAGGSFDIILSDDGYQDPRLAGALRLLLTAPGERPGLFDLLPGGAFRETWKASLRADLRLEGPLFREPGGTVSPELRSRTGIPDATETRRFPFERRLMLPSGFDPGRPWIVFCALGDNRPFLGDLARAGVRPAAVIEGRNHAAPPLKKLQTLLALHPGAGILCTRKDGLKLESANPLLPLLPLGQVISLDAEVASAVMAYHLRFGNGNLVHYPG